MQDKKNDIIETLHKYPIIQVACQKCGLARSTFYRRREDDEDFKYDTKMAIYRGKKFINDIAETNLL
jgi:ACT domain-containing protein